MPWKFANLSTQELAKKWGATNLINPYSLPEGFSIKEEILRAAVP